MGSYLGSIVGWRGVFLGAAALALLALVWQWLALPAMPARGRTCLATMVHLLLHPQVRLGMLGVLLAFGGHTTYFTYLRPFLEDVTHVGVRELSGILLGSGIASVVGTSLAGTVLAWNLRRTLALLPLLMSMLAGGLVVFGSVPLVTAMLVALWGCAFSIIPVGWTTWLTRTVPDQAESGGGLFVATNQLAVTLGAAGGIAIDRSGAVGVVVVGGSVLLLSSPVAALALRAHSTTRAGRAASGS
jgi:predicted MFS family arabinose efflux permease